MAEPERTTARRPRTSPSGVPAGLLEELTAPATSELRRDEVARGRRHAVDRTYDDGHVVAEIASQLLTLSARAAR